MRKKKDKKIKELEKKIKELEAQDSQEEKKYVLSEAMIMSNAINDVIDLKAFMGIDKFDVPLYQRIFNNFMDGMIKAGYIEKNEGAA